MGISHLGGDIEINLTKVTKVTKTLQDKSAPSLPAYGYRLDTSRTGEARSIIIIIIIIIIYKTGKSPVDGVNGVMASPEKLVSDANDGIDAILDSFTGDVCVDCGLPIIDGSVLWWRGRDRVCRRCWKTRKLREEHPTYAEDPDLPDVEGDEAEEVG
jgi:hypothetical protein